MAETDESDATTILDLPYADRQLILVTEDEVAIAGRKTLERHGTESPGEIDWLRFAPMALAFLPGIGPLALAARELLDLWGRARQTGVNAVLVGRSEAAGLDFPPGHPRPTVLYIGHPAVPSTYYTTAEFHRATFEHKVAEAVSLLMHLGCTKLRVLHVAGWSKDFSSRLTLPLGVIEESVGAEAGTSEASGSRMLYEATFDGSTEPCIPESLIWFPHEPSWQSIATGRMKFGLKQFSLTVSYEDDFGVNAGLKARVQSAGLELGGRFEDHRSTVWRIEGEF